MAGLDPAIQKPGCGLDPAIEFSFSGQMAFRFFVYILASQRNGTLYIGVTNDVARRVLEHKERRVEGFIAKYGVCLLVWYEEHRYIDRAIQREKSLKKWPRQWKLDLIEAGNPEWIDLYATLHLESGSPGQARR